MSHCKEQSMYFTSVLKNLVLAIFGKKYTLKTQFLQFGSQSRSHAHRHTSPKMTHGTHIKNGVALISYDELVHLQKKYVTVLIIYH